MPIPSGTVTFLFTDIEGSTKLWEQHPEAMRLALARHDALLHQAIEDNEGTIFKTIGDAFCAAFATAPDALAAAVASHLLLLNEEWGETGPLRVRMGLHTGQAEERDGDYFGPTLNRVARLQSVAHGQQTLLSQATYQLVCHDLLPDATLQDMGQHRLKDLLAPEHVWQLRHPAFPAEFPPLKSLDYLPTNLPRQMTSFIGREREMDEVKRLLPSTPLLTLAGSGGAGKTRLAVQVGADVLDDYKEGVWLVELAALADPALVPQTVANALGVREEPGCLLQQTIQDYLRDRHLLLILDNCEHLVEACALLADTLLKTCPNLTILATSREPLGIAGEHPWRVPSLLTPAPNKLPGEEKDLASILVEYDACRLFVERAMVQRPDFVLTRGNVPVVAQLCHRLDGIPLAIELAAARVRSLSVEEINSRLDNRFRLLTGGSRTALPRHQTLRALIDWSYDLLTDQEKALLCRLSVFAGGWTLEAAEAVGIGNAIEEWEVLDLLTSLADKSLVLAEQEQEQTRYRLLETVRQYARDRLEEGEEGEAVRNRHQAFFLAFAEEAELQVAGSDGALWLRRLESDHDNLRVALERDNTEAALRIAGALHGFWMVRGYYTEGRKWLEDALARIDDQAYNQARAKALKAAGWLARVQSNFAVSQALLEQGLALCQELGDKKGIANFCNSLGLVAQDQGDYAVARLLYEQNLALCQELGIKQGMAYSLGNLGNIAWEQGDYGTAQALQEQAMTLNRELGNKQGMANTFSSLGLVACEQGDYGTAQALHKQGMTLYQELGDKHGLANSLLNLGNVATAQGNNVAAHSLHEASLALYQELGDKRSVARSLLNLGNVSYDQDDYAVARSLYEQSMVLCQALGDKSGTASSLLNLGNVAYARGDHAEAHTLIEQSLALYQELEDKLGTAYSLEGFASIASVQKQAPRASQIWGAAEALREVIGSPLPPSERAEYNNQVAQTRSAMDEAVFTAAWAQGRAMSMEEAIAYALEHTVP